MILIDPPKTIRTQYYLYDDVQFRDIDCNKKVSRVYTGSIVQTWYACKKKHSVWILAHPFFHYNCKSCNESIYEIKGSFNQKHKNIFTAVCTDPNKDGLTCGEKIHFDCYKIKTPDQPVGVWRKIENRWYVKLISGTITEKTKEVILLSKKGKTMRKINRLDFIEETK